MYPNINSGIGAQLASAVANRTIIGGRVFFVLSASATYKAEVEALFPTYPDGTRTVYTTMATALAACVASRGDTVFVLPGYTETVTAAITVSKAGVQIIGLGNGLLRPSITGNGTIDAINVTGAHVLIENIQFPAPETDNQTADVNIDAAGVTLRKLYSIGSQTAKNKTDIITITANGHDACVEQCVAYNTVVDCVSWLSLEGAANRVVIRDNVVMGTFSTAALMDEATATLAFIRSNVLKNTKAATAVVTFTTGNTTGVMSFNHISGRHTTIASNVVAGTGMDFFENRVVEEAALNGMVMPAADAE
jgi:hypothetical protein